jgi:hypothetical protein
MRSRPAFRRGAARWALAILLAPFSVSASAASPEADVKAAYLYKLASFVRWPDEGRSGGAFNICVAGRGDIAGVLAQLVRGQRVAGHTVAVQQLTSAQAERARDCQMLFVGRGAAATRALLAAVRGQPVLTVGDRNNGTAGGVIDFVMRDGRVRLAIDRGAAEGQHLELSSKLLDVAVKVTP